MDSVGENVSYPGTAGYTKYCGIVGDVDRCAVWSVQIGGYVGRLGSQDSVVQLSSEA